jgi:hypothetical protein
MVGTFVSVGWLFKHSAETMCSVEASVPEVSITLPKYILYFNSLLVRIQKIEVFNLQFWHLVTDKFSKLLKKLRGFSPRVNCTDRATATCRRNYCQLLRIEDVAWSARRIPRPKSRYSRWETDKSDAKVKYSYDFIIPVDRETDCLCTLL